MVPELRHVEGIIVTVLYWDRWRRLLDVSRCSWHRHHVRLLSERGMGVSSSSSSSGGLE